MQGTDEQLTITLWDFSWYTRTGPGEPFADLDAAFEQAADRGYNTIRICAMPLRLFGAAASTEPLRIEPLGGGFGQRTRWYDIAGPTELDPLEHTLRLFRAAQRHGFRVIVSSWEYQQSTSFSADRRWYDAIVAVPPAERPVHLANALADLVDALAAEGLDGTIAFVELHNEVQFSRLTDGVEGDPVRELTPWLERGIDAFKQRHRDVLCTANYAGVPTGSLADLPRNMEVAVFHPYINGVLEQMQTEFALRSPALPFPQQRVRDELLRPGAPDLDDWHPGAENAWKLEATVVGRELYLHDWCDPAAFDRWLVERYHAWAPLMRERLANWIAAASDFARLRGLPLVFGEGWVGYTPLHGRFEEDAIGAGWCRTAMRLSARYGAWGSIVCSNAAPHHPMWADVALQRECNAILTGAAV